MTIKYLLWYRCTVCLKDYLGYYYGRFLNCYLEDLHTDGICFFDHRIGEIHNNHVLNPLKDSRKCKKCSRANQLEEFI